MRLTGSRRYAEGIRRSFAAAPWLAIYVAIIVLFIASYWIVGADFTSFNTVTTILFLASFVAIVGAGQGLVILTGGLDLSVVWVITLAGVLTTRWMNGADTNVAWALPAILAVGAGIGAINGFGVGVLRVSPIIFTIATNFVVQGVVLVTTNGTPKGADAPAILQRAMNDEVVGIPVIVFLLAGFTVVVSIIMSKTIFGQKTYAVGNSAAVARLTGVRVPLTLIGVYAFSGLTAALTGVLLTGYTSQSFLGMGDPYLLPSIAAVVLGGASIVGGSGHYIGTLGGAIFLTLLGTVIGAMGISDAFEQIIFGCTILVAVIAARERSLV